MNKFEKQLEKWNKGVLRGAQAKLAKHLKVSTATTALWATGKRHPSKGYVAQMADLFGLDTYSVLRLFEVTPSTVYPDPVVSSPTQVLRERTAPEFTYSATPHISTKTHTTLSNTVTLPFLTTAASNYPSYPPEHVIEWWSIPLRYAQGAKYLLSSQSLSLPDANSSDDLCFVRPTTSCREGQTVLLANNAGQCLARRTLRKNHSLSYVSLEGKPVKTPKGFKLIGQLVKRIKPI